MDYVSILSSTLTEINLLISLNYYYYYQFFLSYNIFIRFNLIQNCENSTGFKRNLHETMCELTVLMILYVYNRFIKKNGEKALQKKKKL